MAVLFTRCPACHTNNQDIAGSIPANSSILEVDYFLNGVHPVSLAKFGREATDLIYKVYINGS